MVEMYWIIRIYALCVGNFSKMTKRKKIATNIWFLLCVESFYSRFSPQKNLPFIRRFTVFFFFRMMTKCSCKVKWRPSITMKTPFSSPFPRMTIAFALLMPIVFDDVNYYLWIWLQRIAISKIYKFDCVRLQCKYRQEYNSIWTNKQTEIHYSYKLSNFHWIKMPTIEIEIWIEPRL